MRETLKEILAVAGVRGALVFAASGELLQAAEAAGERPAPRNALAWAALLAPLGEAPEAELVYAGARVFVRRSAALTLVVLAGPEAAGAVIRLHSDTILPRLAARPPRRGLRRLWERR